MSPTTGAHETTSNPHGQRWRRARNGQPSCGIGAPGKIYSQSIGARHKSFKGLARTGTFYRPTVRVSASSGKGGRVTVGSSWITSLDMKTGGNPGAP